MAEFAYNSANISSTDCILFKFNYGFHPRVLFKEDVDTYSKSCLAKKLADKLRKLIEVGCQNILYV